MNDVIYLVVRQVRCPECQGYGVRVHPAWHRFWEKYGARGAALSEQVLHEELGCPLPPEEIACPECDGQGYIREEISLAEALAALGVMDG